MPAPGGHVPVIDRARRPDLAEFLKTAPVQRLVAGHVDGLVLVRVKSYRGRARLRPDATVEREVRLNAGCDPSRGELVVVLCHELAHHRAGMGLHHAPKWRRAYAELVREAQELGLLTREEAEGATDAALHGPSSAGLDWREKRSAREQSKRDSDADALAPLLAAGMRVGSQVAFIHRGKRVVAEVTRINRRTVSAVSRNRRIRYRFSFPLVELVQ